MKALRLIRSIMQLSAEPVPCPLTGTDCDEPHLREKLGITSCEQCAKCPMGKHRKVIPLIQLYQVEERRNAWRHQGHAAA